MTDLLTVTSTRGWTVLLTLALLLLRFGSPTSGEVTDAVLVCVRSLAVVLASRATMVTVAEAPLLKVPRLQLTFWVGPLAGVVAGVQEP